MKQIRGVDAPIGETVRELLDNCTPLKTATVEREDLLAKTESLRKPNESLLAFISRTGLSPSQIFDWKVSRLREWIEMLARNDAEGHTDVKEPVSTFHMKEVHV